MPTSQVHISAHTPMGANLVGGGATFRAWALRAQEVHISGELNGCARDESTLMVKDAAGYWSGFVPGIKDGDHYKFFVVGAGSQGYKRDPYARELSETPAYPRSNCIVRDWNS